MDDYLKKRRSIQSQISRIRPTVIDHVNNPISPVAAQVHLNTITKLKNDCYTNMDQISSLCSDDEYKIHEPVFGDIEDKLAQMEIILSEIIVTAPVTPRASVSNTPSSDIRLPRLDLPKFNGDLTDWMSFKDLFEASVHTNSKLTDAQRLTYLKSSLTGTASKILGSMSSTDANYNIAWNTLKNRFENERELVFSILRKFLGQPAMPNESATALRKLIDTSNECVRSLDNLNVPVNRWDVIIVFIMLQRVDSSTRQLWELSLKNTNLPVLSEFLEFLEQRARAIAASSINKSGSSEQKNGQRNVMAHFANYKASCRSCSESHPLFKCSSFNAMSVQERRNLTKKHSLCFNCLAEGHTSIQCKSKFTCKVCKSKHHSLLHIEEQVKNGTAEVIEPNSTSSVLNHHINHEVMVGQGMLATAMVIMIDRYKQPQHARAFLDAGSTSSFITDSYARRLGLIKRKVSATINGLGSSNAGIAKGIVTVELHSHFHLPGDETFYIDMLVIPSITCNLPTHPCNPQEWTHLHGLKLADPHYHKPSQIDIILGSDVFWDLLLHGKKTGAKGDPIAHDSKLGWLIAGQVKLKSTEILVHHADVVLDKRLQTFWELESLPTTRILTKEEKACEEHFCTTTARDGKGNFIVSLPFRNLTLSLGASRDNAARRLFGLEKRLKANPQHKKEYVDFMREYLALGHMEKVSPNSTVKNSAGIYYIPHHYVLKPSSTTTQFRVVFDASSKTSTGISLNNELMVGPTIQPSLISTLMKFRTHVFAFTADLSKMYRQIRINPSHADLQRILWRENPSDEIEEFRLVTVTYGTASGSFHATRVLKQLAIEKQNQFPSGCEVVANTFM